MLLLIQPMLLPPLLIINDIMIKATIANCDYFNHAKAATTTYVIIDRY